MAQRNQAFLDELAESTISRLLLVIGTTLVIAATSSLIFLSPLANFPSLLKYAVVITLGIAAAITARILLANHTFLLKLLTTFVSLTGGLFLLRHLSRGYIGLTPNPAPAIEWDGLAQLGLATTISWLVLRSGRKSPHQKEKVPAFKPVKFAKKPERKPQKVKIPSSKEKAKKPSVPTGSSRKADKIPISSPWWFLNAWNKSWSQSLKRVKKTVQYLRTGVSHAFSIRPQWLANRLPHMRGKIHSRGQIAKSAQPFANLSIKKSRLAAPQVRLLSEEEHRCPYCLEIVQKNDLRGVKICPICGTHHHADCWAVTGVCQVPHQHE